MTAASAPKVAEIAAALRRAGKFKIRISGFADVRGPAKYNLRLTERRAKAVRNLLVKAGLKASSFELVGRGATGVYRR